MGWDGGQCLYTAPGSMRRIKREYLPVEFYKFPAIHLWNIISVGTSLKSIISIIIDIQSFTETPFLCCNDDHAVCCFRSPDRSCRSVFENGNIFYVLHV